MSALSMHRRLTAFLLFAVVLVLACGLTSAPPAEPGIDPTVAVLQIQATSLALQMTQAALQNSAQQSVQQPGQATIGPIQETQGVYTETATPRITLQSGVIEITYGEKLASYPRKAPDVLYGFKGFKGDVVTLIVESSNAHPADPKCKALTASTTFTLKTPNTILRGNYESSRLSSMRDYELPATGAYYVDVSCMGSACNGNCTQVDLSLEKQ